MRADTASLELRISHHFSDTELLRRALTHSSLANESRTGPSSPLNDNEQLEFLGDSVLGFLIAEALILPSRHRVPWDDAVVDLARQAGRPVVTTVGGPAHLVKHDHNGIITYDNPGSMVWAIDQILHNSEHAQRMGENGRRSDGPGAIDWPGVAKHYLELCALSFPELRSAD